MTRRLTRITKMSILIILLISQKQMWRRLEADDNWTIPKLYLQASGKINKRLGNKNWFFELLFSLFDNVRWWKCNYLKIMTPRFCLIYIVAFWKLVCSYLWMGVGRGPSHHPISKRNKDRKITFYIYGSSGVQTRDFLGFG